MHIVVPVFVLCTLSFVLGSTCPSPGALVNLRVEGANQTIFEGPIYTRGHNVTTESGGTHHCDGTNNNRNPKPGPTCTSALDTASRFFHFTWDGTFSTKFDDFLITRIGNDTQTKTQFWSLLLNYEFTEFGGCQTQVKRKDQVLWAFDAYNKKHLLKLEGPHFGTAHKPIQLTVTDGKTGSPIAGATVHDQTSDSDGHVSITFERPGIRKVKAEKEDSLRSNTLIIVVKPKILNQSIPQQPIMS